MTKDHGGVFMRPALANARVTDSRVCQIFCQYRISNSASSAIVAASECVGSVAARWTPSRGTAV